MSSGFRFWYLSALPENVDFPLRNFNFYRFLCFSFYFLKSQLCVSLLSHLPLLPPFRCFSTFDLYFLTSFCYSMREGEDEPHNRHDSLKHIPMIHIFPLIHSNISIAIILHLEYQEGTALILLTSCSLKHILHTRNIQLSDNSSILPCPAKQTKVLPFKYNKTLDLFGTEITMLTSVLCFQSLLLIIYPYQC